MLYRPGWKPFSNNVFINWIAEPHRYIKKIGWKRFPVYKNVSFMVKFASISNERGVSFHIRNILSSYRLTECNRFH
jgi:hypothetical protein